MKTSKIALVATLGIIGTTASNATMTEETSNTFHSIDDEVVKFKDHHQRWWFDNVKHSKCFMS